jgi:hypothetical protein
MRGSKAKFLRETARRISSEEQLPVRKYKLLNEQVKYFSHPLIQQPIEYHTATIVLDDSQRKVFKQLKKNLKTKYS